MNVKIAISNGNSKFHEFAVAYCERNHVSYKVVDFYSSRLVDEISDCSAVFWHFNSADRFATDILYALENAGYVVFPDFRTSWSFDNKRAQAIYFAAAGMPTPQTFLFFDENEALDWACSTKLPIVWKLSTGAGSQNVRLIRTRRELIRLAKKSFKYGFWTYRRWYILRWRIDQLFLGQVTIIRVIAAIYRLFVLPRYILRSGREVDYLLAQEFIDGNDRDIRIIVIGQRAFGIVRKNRRGDFRASASGLILHDPSLIDRKYVELGFEIAGKLGSQCVAFDFVERADGQPLVLEICYGFTPEGYFECPGYWNSDLTWVDGVIEPYGWMIDVIVDQATSQ